MIPNLITTFVHIAYGETQDAQKGYNDCFFQEIGIHKILTEENPSKETKEFLNKILEEVVAQKWNHYNKLIQLRG